MLAILAILYVATSQHHLHMEYISLYISMS